MIEKHMNSLSVWFFESLLKYGGICHFVSGRTGGFSSPPYNSLNLGFHVGDDPKKVLENRKVLASTLGISLDSFTFAEQIHDSRVRVVTEELKSSGGVEYKTAIDATDALVTDVPNICIIVLLGDCVPILFFDVKQNVIGVAHAGWRGTVRLVAEKTIRVFQERFRSKLEDIIVGIGPSIGPCCYEVGTEVVSQIENVFHGKAGYINSETSDGRCYLDLWEANRAQLVKVGIPEGNIELSRICTYCKHSLFFSRRHQRGETGRFGAGIMIKGL